jgi:hypothetical protein
MEQDGVTNSFHVRVFEDEEAPPDMQSPITFITTDEKNLLRPSPRLLALHAACAKVFNHSGAAVEVERLDNELQDSTVLDADGSSSKILSYAIAR